MVVGTTANAGRRIDVVGIMPRSVSIDEFLKIEDQDLKKYLFLNGYIMMGSKYEKIDNDTKTGYYYYDQKVMANNQGSFYKHSQLLEWIVYDKATKKVKVSRKSVAVFNELLKEKFGAESIGKSFFRKASPTLCKKIIEGKISTVKDILEYHRSYVAKNKNLDLTILFKAMILDGEYVLPVIEDPNNMTDEQIRKISDRTTVPQPLVSGRVFKFKIDDIDKVGRMYDEWYEEQNKKFDTLIRCRDDKNGNSDGKNSAAGSADFFNKIYSK